jgi:hypothetical protein
VGFAAAGFAMSFTNGVRNDLSKVILPLHSGRHRVLDCLSHVCLITKPCPILCRAGFSSFCVLPTPSVFPQFRNMEATHDINETIKDQMLEWVQHFMTQRKAALLKGKKGVDTGELLRSFEIAIEKTVKEEGIALLIAFNEEGRLIDMKPNSLHFSDKWGRNAIDRLEAWIQRKGIGSFVPGYLKKHPQTGFRKGINLTAIIHNIAWGIAINRTKGNFKRGKHWWNPAKTAGTYELINKVAAALPSPTLDAIKKELLKSN